MAPSGSRAGTACTANINCTISQEVVQHNRGQRPAAQVMTPPSPYVYRPTHTMSGNGSGSDGAHPRAHEAVDCKIKYTLETFERIHIQGSNVEYVFRDGALKLSYAEALTDGTKASRMLQLWLATPRPSDAERARLADNEHEPAVQSMAVALQVLSADELQEIAKTMDVPVATVRMGGKMRVPAKWKVVLRCIREAVGADARMVAALDDTTIERLYRRVAWNPIMQQLIGEVYVKNTTVVQSPTPAHLPQEHSPRRSPRLNRTEVVQDENAQHQPGDSRLP